MDEPRDSRELRFGFRPQSVFATPEALSADFVEAIVDPFSVDRDVIIVELPANHGSRNPVQQDSAHSTKGSSATFPINCPVNKNTLDQFLYAFFQKVVEAADTEHTKTFTFFTTHPVFSDDEGHFLTWIVRRPITATSSTYGGCICRRIKLSGERDGLLRFESDWQGFGGGADGETPSGTWTVDDPTGLIYFNDCVSATLSFDVGFDTPFDVIVKDFEIEASHEHEKAGHTSAGYEAPVLSGRKGTFKVHLLRDSTADEQLVNLKSGALIEFSMDFGSVAFTITGKITAIETDNSGTLAESLTCDMFASYVSETVGQPLTIVVENEIDRNWPAA
jgi:hypothetical protein